MESGYNRPYSYSYPYSNSQAHGGYSYSMSSSNNMQLQPYYGGGGGGGGSYWPPHELRYYSASCTQTQTGNPYNNPGGSKNVKLKNGKSTSRFGPKSWSFGDSEFQRKKRVATYKMYSVEGKVKGTFRRSFRWIKDRYTHVVHGWW